MRDREQHQGATPIFSLPDKEQMDKEQLVQQWSKCLSIISDNIPASAYNMWFANITPLTFENHELYLEVPSQFVYEYIEEHYIDLLYSTICRIFGVNTNLMYRVLTDKANQLSVDQESENKHSSVGQPQTPTPEVFGNKTPGRINVSTQDLDPMLRTSYSFDTFVEGQGNKLARAVGQSIAQDPDHTIFNPLFIYGASGVGKTHLINAVGLKIKEIFPEKRVLYVSAHLFKVQYMDAVRKNSLTDFINFYQTIDVLIIDDIQEFVGAEKTQNTFFHIFNHLHQNGRMLIMSCDRHPSTLEGIEDRLITRFKWGIVAEIERPDFDLRKAILESKIHHDGIHMSNEVIEYIAQNVTDSVRELEGILNSIMAHATIMNKDADVTLARRIIDKAIIKAPREVTIDSILNAVCAHYHVTNEEISSGCRKHAIVQARQVAMYLSQQHVKDITLSRIGEHIGQKDHSTVLHACKNIKDTLAYDKDLKNDIEEIEKSVLQR